MRIRSEQFKILNAYQLKCIAIFSMLTDHTGAILFPDVIALRYIGRLAFPIFCFLLVEGFFHTRNVYRYLGRLGIFALLSEIPFNLAFFHRVFFVQRQNVFLTLFIGMAMMLALEKSRDMPLAQLAEAGAAALAADYLHTDYGYMGILLIGLFYWFRRSRSVSILAGAGWNFLWAGRVQKCGALAMIPIALYNGEKGRGMKYFFYLFYPLHLLALWGIWQILYG